MRRSAAKSISAASRRSAGGRTADRDRREATAPRGRQQCRASSWEVEQRLWDEASKRDSIPYYEAYLDQFPAGRFATVARLNIDQINEKKSKPAGRERSRRRADRRRTDRRSAPASSCRTRSRPCPARRSPRPPSASTVQARIDLQLRLEALGFELGSVDGSLGQPLAQGDR